MIYFMALFINKYLYTNQLNLAFEEINILEKLEKLILSNSII